MLVQKMELGDIQPIPIQIPEGDVFSLPYSATGRLTSGSTTTLDLRVGAEVKIAVPEASNYGVVGTVTGKNADGHYIITMKEKLFSFNRVLGKWWIDAASRGAIPILPIVNTDAHNQSNNASTEVNI